MKERPILFSAPMVRAILEGKKTQTRRIVNPQPFDESLPSTIQCELFHPHRVNRHGESYPGPETYGFYSEDQDWRCPYGAPGDQLWVRESISEPYIFDVDAKKFTGFYRADDPDRQVRWIPSIHMPRWASRISLEVTQVRVQRLKDITEEDAIAEGFRGERCYRNPRFKNLVTDDGTLPEEQFLQLWDELNIKRGYGAHTNPWVWAISFKVWHRKAVKIAAEPVSAQL